MAIPRDWEKQLGVKPPGSSGETILQRRLQAFEEFEQSFKKTKRDFKKMQEAMRDDMIRGATVEPGTLGLKGDIRVVHRVKAKDAIIKLAGGGEDGEKYYQKLLARSDAHAYFHVRLIRRKS